MERSLSPIPIRFNIFLNVSCWPLKKTCQALPNLNCHLDYRLQGSLSKGNLIISKKAVEILLEPVLCLSQCHSVVHQLVK